MQTLNFATTSNSYSIGQMFVLTYNKRTDDYSAIKFNAIDGFAPETIDTLNGLVAMLQTAKAERSFCNTLKNGFNQVSEDGKFGTLPSDVRSKVFSALKNAVQNTIFVVSNIVETETDNVVNVEYVPLFASEINLAKTNLGMNKKAYECAKSCKHMKQWRKFANTTMLQGNIVSFAESIRNGKGEAFLSPYLETLGEINKMREDEETAAAV